MWAPWAFGVHFGVHQGHDSAKKSSLLTCLIFQVMEIQTCRNQNSVAWFGVSLLLFLKLLLPMAVPVILIQGGVWPHKCPILKHSKKSLVSWSGSPNSFCWLPVECRPTVRCGLQFWYFFLLRCAPKTVWTTVRQVCLGQAEMCSYHRAHYVHIMQYRAIQYNTELVICHLHTPLHRITCTYVSN